MPETESIAAIDRIFPTLSRSDPVLPMRTDSPGANGGAAPASEHQMHAESAEPDAAAADDDDTTELHGWTKDPERLRETLIAIDEVSNDSLAVDLERFVNMLKVRLGWQGLRRKQIGGIFPALVRRGYLEQVKRGTVRLGYRLTGAGNRIIRDKLSMATRRTATRSPRRSPTPPYGRAHRHHGTVFVGVPETTSQPPAAPSWPTNRAT